MHHFTAVIFAFLVLFSAEIVCGAVPERRHDKPPHHKQRNHCLTAHEAEGLRDLWISFFENVSDGGVEIRNSVTDDFKFFSQGLNSATPGWNLPVCFVLSCNPIFAVELKRK
jgi:hypothetical protein